MVTSVCSYAVSQYACWLMPGVRCSVNSQEVVEAIARQTNKTLPKENFNLPDIKEIGLHDASVKLHPEVTGTFKILVSRAKQS